MRSLILVPLLVLSLIFNGCSSNPDEWAKYAAPKEQRLFSLKDSILVDAFSLNQPPVILGDRSVLFDKQGLFLQDLNDPAFHLKLSGYERAVSNLSVIKDSLLVVNGVPNLMLLNKLGELVWTQQHPIDLASNLISDYGLTVVAGVNRNSGQMDLGLHTLQFQEDTVLVTDFGDLTSWIDVPGYLKLGKLLKLENKIVFIYSWLGEYYVHNRTDYELQKHDTLRYFGDLDYYVNNIGQTPPYFQCYDAATLGDSLVAVLREVDFETVNPSEPKESTFYATLRRRVQLFDENMNWQVSGLLARQATSISFIDGTLFAHHQGSDYIYLYEVNQDILPAQL
ncbi:MAG TPA: hypothetical protein DCE41_15240 [Cytophagales bacterium]|nr:hypothetical protein [Cytophagales bacterium]HAA17939.1 hypothetical protein [Cytophagales bacterium]HAP62754.1 hypothetical protein [Cytophagales bacterium]